MGQQDGIVARVEQWKAELSAAYNMLDNAKSEDEVVLACRWISYAESGLNLAIHDARSVPA